MVLCILAWSTEIYLLFGAIRVRGNIDDQAYTLSRMWQGGVGAVSIDFLVSAEPRRSSLLENVLLANTP